MALDRHTGNEVWHRVVESKTSTRLPRSTHAATLRGSVQGLDYYVVGTDQSVYFINRTDGSLLSSYEYISPKLGTRTQDAGWTGLGSSPLIEGDRLWLTTNRSEVLCWDIGPLIRGEGTPRELWKQGRRKSHRQSQFGARLGVC